MDKIISDKLDNFFSQFHLEELKKNEVLIQPGKEPQGIFYIQEGVVRRYFLSVQGAEITLNLYKPNSFLPMSWAIAEIPNMHFYEAMTSVKVKRAPKEAVIAFLKKEPDIVYDLLRRIYLGMEGLWMQLETVELGKSQDKLIVALVILAKRFGTISQSEEVKKDTVINLPINEKDIASYIGISRETVSRQLQKLKKTNLIGFEKKTITIHNLQALEDMLLH